jgi:hypothetical protein
MPQKIFTAGTKNVFVTLPASKAVILDSSGNITANNGSNLTDLNATNLASGTVPDARFPATLPAIKVSCYITSSKWFSTNKFKCF